MLPCYCSDDRFQHSLLLQFCTTLYLNFDIAQAIKHAHPLKFQCPMMAVFVSGICALGGQQLDSNSDLTAILHSTSESDIHPIIEHHKRAIDHYRQHRRRLAIQSWLEVLAHNPADLLALKFLTTACFFIGDADTMVEVCQSSVEYIPSSDRHHVWAMLAFALVEKGDATTAEKYASRALNRCCHSPWSVHALCHVYLEQGRITEGLELLTGNDQQWRHHEDLSCHIYWHWAIFSLYYDNFTEALAIYDQEVFPRVLKSAGFPMDVSDAVSLLIRFDMVDVNMGARWTALKEAIGHEIPHFLTYPFTASHFFILSYRICAQSTVENLPTALDQEPSNILTLFYSGLQAYMHRNFEAAFDNLFAVLSRLRCVGGSNAQRDVFVLICIDAAMKCEKEHLALRLLTIRTPISVQNKLRASASSRLRHDPHLDYLIIPPSSSSIEVGAFRYKLSQDLSEE